MKRKGSRLYGAMTHQGKCCILLGQYLLYEYTRFAEENKLDIDLVSSLIKRHSLQTLGMAKFMIQNKLEEQPVVLAPASNHYSWPKGMTLLGLGDEQLLPIAVDETGRQNVESLRKLLQECLNRRRPVLAVVSVMGTTEEGAIDPLEEILKIKGEFEKRGLCFCVHADAAWGGYLCTLLEKTKSTKNQNRIVSKSPTFVFSSPLNKHSKKQLEALEFADSITVDPHKTGFIPYPAGGLCYKNGNMRNFVTLTAPVVFHGGSDPNIGVYGIEGSKPGAAAVASLLSHRVIGLDHNGYGRIMAQCITGAKMFYCLWLTVAKDNDPFECVPIFPPGSGMSMEAARKYAQNNITNRPYSELIKDKAVNKFLSDIGGDAMVNAFLINVKGNREASVANELTSSVFRKLSYRNALNDCNKRVPMILTQSEKSASIGVGNLRKLKQRIGLNDSDDDVPISFLINTVLNPWLSSYEMVAEMGTYFREKVLLAIGELQDEPHNHGFISAGIISDEGLIYGDHLPVFTETVHQYHAIAKFKFHDKKAVKKFKDKQLELLRVPEDRRVPVIFGNPNVMTLPDLMQSEKRLITMECFEGLPSETNPAFMKTKECKCYLNL